LRKGGKAGGKAGGKKVLKNKTGIFDPANTRKVQAGNKLGGSKSGGSKGKAGGNKPGCGEGSHSALRTKKVTTQLNYLAYCASPAGKAYFANRDTPPAPPDHYLKLLKLNPPLHFMNASGPNKVRVTLKYKQSKT
jgi:hypothetical protein